MLPKSLWDIMVDWYGGGPVFCRKVVNVSSSLQLPASVGGGVHEAEAASRADRYIHVCNCFILCCTKFLQVDGAR